jgi:hypothetical protein
MPEPERVQQTRAHWVRVLFVLPFIATLYVPFYNSVEPVLLGFPFFYWFQLLWVIIAAAIAGLVYVVEHRDAP